MLCSSGCLCFSPPERFMTIPAGPGSSECSPGRQSPGKFLPCRLTARDSQGRRHRLALPTERPALFCSEHLGVPETSPCPSHAGLEAPSPRAASQALSSRAVHPHANDKCTGTWRKSSLGQWPHSCSFWNVVHLCLSLFCLLSHHLPSSLNNLG